MDPVDCTGRLKPPAAEPEGAKSVLWAPWRLAYVLSAKEGGCILCAKAAQTDDEANLILARGRFCFAILNLFPYNNGHLMIVPFRHVDKLAELTPDEMLEMMCFAQAAEGVLRAAMSPEGLNIGMNLGKVAGAGIDDHLHLHLVPRWNGDTNFMPVLTDTNVISQSLAETYRQLCGPLQNEVNRFAALSPASAGGSTPQERD
ncbi:MAG: HIT domain-containing protein [Armatimonadetes bacterium]|nr:HIT domain-containing protein [Armatimonadota bacterium]NCP29631.1 HIT domain-containing protein [Armatimonadota bacterium]